MKYTVCIALPLCVVSTLAFASQTRVSDLDMKVAPKAQMKKMPARVIESIREESQKNQPRKLNAKRDASGGTLL